MASCQDKTGKDQLQRLRLFYFIVQQSVPFSTLNTQHSTEPGKKQHLLRPNKVRKRVLLAKLVGLVFALQSDLLPLSDPRPSASYTALRTALYFIVPATLCVCYHLSVHFLLIILYCLSIYFKFGEERNSAHVRLDGELQLFSAKRGRSHTDLFSVEKEDDLPRRLRCLRHFRRRPASRPDD